MFGSIQLVEVGFVLNRDSSLTDGSKLFFFKLYIYGEIYGTGCSWLIVRLKIKIGFKLDPSF